MESTQHEHLSLPSPGLSITSSTCLDIPSAGYLTVPGLRTQRPTRRQTRPDSIDEEDPGLLIPSELSIALQISVPLECFTPTDTHNSSSPRTWAISLSNRLYMSVYSSSSVDTAHSEYSNPPARSYRVPDFSIMSSQKITPVRYKLKPRSVEGLDLIACRPRRHNTSKRSESTKLTR
jgi:hypothetical protein